MPSHRHRRPAGVLPAIGPPGRPRVSRSRSSPRIGMANPLPDGRGRDEGRHRRRTGRLEHRQLHLQRQEIRGAGSLVRGQRGRDLQPQRDVGAGQGRGPGRQRLHLPRPWQRLTQPVRPLRTPRPRTASGSTRRPGNGNSNTKYYGEYYVRTQIQLARNSVVILNRLCYASGNSEWGAPQPDEVSTARQRVDNFAAGFLRTNARAVFAEGINSISYILYGLFRTSRTIKSIFYSAPSWNGHYDFQFASVRTPGNTAWMDPMAPGRYYRSVVGYLGLTAATFRSS